MSEQDLQRLILSWLDKQGYCYWRNFVGPILLAGRGRKPNPMAGLPDILGVMRHQPGRLFGIEVKVKDGRMSPKQIAWMDRLNECGALVFEARSLATVVDKLAAHDRPSE